MSYPVRHSASGHVKILDGHESVKVNGAPVARHDSRCLINCDASGVGGAEGKLITEQTTASVIVSSQIPPPHQASGRARNLRRLRKLVKAVAANMLDFDAIDEYVNFRRLHEVLDGEDQKYPSRRGNRGRR